ncbi:MAG TPA: ester cyclase [Candidatus Kapabacteria bacterium]|nr:ester cyclase [Candidatus Kapabacteria bacterium]
MDLKALAQQHIEAENVHSAEKTLETVASGGAYYKVYSTGQSFTARDKIFDFYSDIMKAVPDMFVQVEHMIEDQAQRQVFVQYKFSGTHKGNLDGLAPTNRKFSYNGAILYEFDENGKLTKEIQYFDKTELLSALGIIKDTTTQLGKFLLMFPQSPFYTLRCAWWQLTNKK